MSSMVYADLDSGGGQDDPTGHAIIAGMGEEGVLGITEIGADSPS